MKPLCEQSDELLCALASEGDPLAEECLAARYSRLVRACTRPYFLAGGDSEDLIQEGMIGLLSAIRRYTPDRDAGFRTYAETCIRNRIRSAVRSAARDKHDPLNDSVSIDAPLYDKLTHGHPQETDDPEDMLISREDREDRQKALEDRLSDFEKIVLELYLSGLSYGEIAERVDKPLKSVDNAVQRIRRKTAIFLFSGDISAS